MKKLLASMLTALMLLAAVPQMYFADDVDTSAENTDEGISTCEYLEEPMGE